MCRKHFNGRMSFLRCILITINYKLHIPVLSNNVTKQQMIENFYSYFNDFYGEFDIKKLLKYTFKNIHAFPYN